MFQRIAIVNRGEAAMRLIHAVRDLNAQAGPGGHRIETVALHTEAERSAMFVREADAAYDLVFVDGDKAEYGDYFEEALRLLRPGGVVAFDNALWHDQVADPSQRDPETVALRGLVQAVREDERVVSVLLPVGDGLLAAIKQG